MPIRHVLRTVAISAAALAAAGSLSVLGFAGPAGASGPPAGSEVPNSAIPNGASSPGPFSSGQVIHVVIPANSTFTGGQGIQIEECAAPGGVAPVSPSACDGLTIQGDTVLANADGSVNYTQYTVYSLPNTGSLGETPGSQPQCDTSHQCVLYIGADHTDFTKAHFFSQPFAVAPNAGDTGASPGDGTPEAPLAILLPLGGVGLVGGTLLIRRRRRTGSPAA